MIKILLKCLLIFSFLNPIIWAQDKIEYFLNSDKDRQAYIEKGMERVNKEHLDFHRVRQLESLLEKL